jgi:ATP-dependent Clp protease ATP-binding subunit ClpC
MSKLATGVNSVGGLETNRARNAMQIAKQEALRLEHECIDTEHILLGLLIEGEGAPANVFKISGVMLHAIRLDVERRATPGPGSPRGRVPLTPRAKKAIEFAMMEARSLNCHYVDTGHLLLGLMREEEGIAAQVLTFLGFRLDNMRAEVQAMSVRSEDEGSK